MPLTGLRERMHHVQANDAYPGGAPGQECPGAPPRPQDSTPAQLQSVTVVRIACSRAGVGEAANTPFVLRSNSPKREHVESQNAGNVKPSWGKLGANFDRDRIRTSSPLSAIQRLIEK